MLDYLTPSEWAYAALLVVIVGGFVGLPLLRPKAASDSPEDS